MTVGRRARFRPWLRAAAPTVVASAHHGRSSRQARLQRILTIVALLGALSCAPLAVAAALEEVLVTGEQPGPGLWKVTRPGDATGHVLWIVGNYSPLPRKMQWRSHRVQAVLTSSQELLGPVTLDASVGFLGGISMLPSLIGARRNPDGKRLQDVVPPELYARWVPLKTRYLGRDDGVERWRPVFAAQELYLAALKQQGLVPYVGIWPDVEKLARKASVKVTTPEVDITIERPRQAIKEFKATPISDVDCFARTLQRLESDLDLMRERANAWAVGDVARLRALAPVERASACIGAVLESSVVRERGYDDMPQRLKAAWVTAAEQALARNASTVAVLSIEEILKPGGYLARLRADGYTVEDPDS